MKGGSNKNYGDIIVPLDGYENNKTEISLVIDQFFTAIVTISNQNKDIGCRVVPNDGFVYQFGAKAASSVEQYLTDPTKKNQPTYVSLLSLQSNENFDDYLQSDIHLSSIYSLSALTNEQGLQDLFEDFKIPKSIFKGIAIKTLFVILKFCLKLNPIIWSKEKFIGLEADGAIPGALKNQKGFIDRSLLGKYYMSLGFKPLNKLEEEKIRIGKPIFNEIKMNGRFEDILLNLTKIVN